MDDIEYPTEDEIREFHDGIIASDPDADPGIENPGGVETALCYISDGFFGEGPESVHEKAAHLARLITINHVFVDGNKRTATNAAETFYTMNGYVFATDELWEQILVAYACNSDAVRDDKVVDYCRKHAI
jgi:death-on-curing protein